MQALFSGLKKEIGMATFNNSTVAEWFMTDTGKIGTGGVITCERQILAAEKLTVPTVGSNPACRVILTLALSLVLGLYAGLLA